MGIYFFFSMVLGPIFIGAASIIYPIIEAFEELGDKIEDFLFY